MTATTPHQALYRRWRAQTFGQIVGQEAVVETLRNAVRAGKVAHALLFVGPRGTGKTSMARIVAKAVNCTDLRDGEPCDRCAACVSIREGRALDVVEMDAASNNRVDDMRDLLARTMTAPSDLRRKVYIVDEVQRITQGWDVLLRTLEEPPDQVAFIFCTTDAGQIRPAVLSRVQRFDFRRLTVPQIEGKLRMILDADGREAEPEAIGLVARLAAGGMRDAESMLDQLLSSGVERLTAEQVRALLGLADAEAVGRFADALVRSDALAGIAVLDELEEKGTDLRSFLDQVVEVLRESLLASLAGGAPLAPGTGAGAGIAAARRLASVDPAQAGPGGLRFQLELVLLGSPTAASLSLSHDLPARGGAASGQADAPARTSAIPPDRSRQVPAPPARLDGPTSPAAGRAARARSGSADRSDRGPADASAPADAPATATPGAPADAAATAPAPAGAPAPARADPAGQLSDWPAPQQAPAAPTPRGARRERSPSSDPAPQQAPAAPTPRGARRERSPSSDALAAEHTPPPASPPVGVPASEAVPALDELRRRWNDIVRDISQHPPTKPLITACRPISVEGDVVTLGFPEEQAFLKDVAERRRSVLEEGVGRHLGRAVIVRCVATNLDVAAPLSEDEAAARLLDEARRIFADDLVDVGEVG